MRERTRIVPLGTAAILAATLAACGSNVPLTQTSSYPAPVMQSSVATTAPAGPVYGRVTNIQVASSAPQGSQPNALGAVVGGVAGAVLGHQVGEGTGKRAATVLGGLGGAALGAQYGRNAGAAPAQGTGYLVTVQTNQGTTRTFEVSAVGDLRVGDPVRVDNGVIYRM